MKRKCQLAVSTALGRGIDGVEAQAIEAHVLRALRQDRKDAAAWAARTPADRVLAAGQRLAREALTDALEARARLAPLPAAARRFAQSERVAGWITRTVDRGDLDGLRAVAADPNATPETILSHPALAAIEAAAPENGTMTPDQAASPEGFAERRYRIDGQEFDADGYVAHMRQRFEAETPVPLRQERIAVIVTGQPGAGKSTTRRALARIYGAASVDLDVMRLGIPEFAEGVGSNHVTQVEAGALRDRVLESMVRDGQNVLFETVGHNADSIAATAEAFRAAGYTVRLANVKVSFANSVRRYALRTLEEGRWVGAAYIRKVGDNPQAVYQALVERGGFDGYIQVDGNGPQGQERIAHAAGIDAGEVEAALRQGEVQRSGSAGDRGGDSGGDQTGGGESLGQPGPLGARGETFIPEGGVFADPGVVISLFETADRSTPLHEFGHVYLETLIAYGARENAPPALTRDIQILREWLGAKDGEALTSAQHEQFARGTEAYLREGNAPSPGLERIFAQFRDWLVALYRSVLDLDVELTPEIRGVFDRLMKDVDDAQSGSMEGGAGRHGNPQRAADAAGRQSADGPIAGERPGAGGRRSGPGADDRAGGDGGAAAKIPPALLARDPELRAIADELAETRAQLDALERQGRIGADEARQARADLDAIEKTSARPDLFKAAAMCLQYGARVNVGT